MVQKNTSKTFYTKLLAYESNKEYLYEYETQALTGIPMGSTIYSGMKMKSDVRIQFRSRSSATLKVSRFKCVSIKLLMSRLRSHTYLYSGLQFKFINHLLSRNFIYITTLISNVFAHLSNACPCNTSTITVI